ncbi:MAG: hypothetical protein KDC92_14505 [Bacteroidetes bacterium]|nr:hypothetical protein [Bacteroidota bacterium]
MAKRNIPESDIALLKDTFFNNLGAVAIYDPKDVVTGNFTDDFIYLKTVEEIITAQNMGNKVLLVFLGDAKEIKQINQDAFGGIVCLDQLKNNHTECVLYFYKSKFNTIRFGYPKELKAPHFYNILHENYEYLWYTKWLDKALFATGLGSLSAQGHYYVYHKKETHVDFGSNFKSNEFFFFSEDYMFDRMSQCFLIDGKSVVQTVKYGDSEFNNERLAHERQILSQIHNAHLNFEVVQVPRIIDVNNDLVLTNNWPNGAEMPDLLQKEHYLGLTEIYSQLKGVKQVGTFITDHNFVSIIQAIKNILAENLQPRGLSAKHIEELCIEILVLLNGLNPTEPFYTSMYHGNFSPANIPVKGGKIYINNWEKSVTEMPLLFDFYYFLFHRMETAENPQMGEFDDLMKRMIKNKHLVAIVKENDINFKLNLALFHAYHIVTRLQVFLRQRFINPNANFILAFWRQTLERVNQLDI